MRNFFSLCLYNLLVCLFVCLNPIYVKTAELINPKFVRQLTWPKGRFKTGQSFKMCAGNNADFFYSHSGFQNGNPGSFSSLGNGTPVYIMESRNYSSLWNGNWNFSSLGMTPGNFSGLRNKNLNFSGTFKNSGTGFPKFPVSIP